MVAAQSTYRVTIGGREASGDLRMLRPLVVEQAKAFAGAQASWRSSEVRKQFRDARLRFGSVLVQLRGQLEHGQWIVFLRSVADEAGLHLSSVRRAVNLAAKVADREGRLNPDMVRAAAAARKSMRTRRGEDANCSHVSNLESTKRIPQSAPVGAICNSDQTDSAKCARGSNLERSEHEMGAWDFDDDLGAEASMGVALSDEDIEAMSARELEELVGVRAAERGSYRAFADAVADEAGERDTHNALVGGASVGAVGEQMSLVSLFAGAEQSLASLEREVAAHLDQINDDTAEKALALAARLRSGADALEEAAGRRAAASRG